MTIVEITGGMLRAARSLTGLSQQEARRPRLNLASLPHGLKGIEWQRLIRRTRDSSRNIRHEQSVGHSLLKIPDHPFPRGSSELDNVRAVIFRPVDHDPVLAGGGHCSRSLSRSRSNRRRLSNARRLASNASSIVSTEVAETMLEALEASHRLSQSSS